MNNDITFRDVTAADLPMLHNWMRQPHWQEWWGDPEVELSYIVDMLTGQDTTRPFIFQVDRRDTGYIQCWTIGDQLFEPWLSEAPWMPFVPAESVGVDLAIGDSSDLSRGIGSKVLRRFVEKLRAEGHSEIIIDPDGGNSRAIRAYEKVGFRPIPALEGKSGSCLIMRHEETHDAVA